MPIDNAQEQYRQEARRLALLPMAHRREAITLYWRVANDLEVPKPQREAGRRMAEALEKLLGLRGQR
jgi:hypothetical protein